MSMWIKIYGERNTNTNHMSRLVELNLNAREIPGSAPYCVRRIQSKMPGSGESVIDLYFWLTFRQNIGWKHMCVAPAEVLKKHTAALQKNVAFLTITKNPYSWLLSLYRRPYHQSYSERPDFETFLRSPWKTVRRDNTAKMLANPVELWNIKNASYFNLDGLHSLSITTESIFRDPEAVIDRISSQLSIERLSSDFIDYTQSTKDKSKDSSYYRDYYLNERWRSEISANAVSIINETLDMKLMSHFGYDVLSPQSVKTVLK